MLQNHMTCWCVDAQGIWTSKQGGNRTKTEPIIPVHHVEGDVYLKPARKLGALTRGIPFWSCPFQGPDVEKQRNLGGLQMASRHVYVKIWTCFKKYVKYDTHIIYIYIYTYMWIAMCTKNWQIMAGLADMFMFVYQRVEKMQVFTNQTVLVSHQPWKGSFWKPSMKT